MSIKKIIHTDFGSFEAPESLQMLVANIPCEGDACTTLQRKFSGRIVVLLNNSGDTISGRIEWGSVFGCDGYSTNFTLFPGEKESYPFPNSGILGVCKITANLN